MGCSSSSDEDPSSFSEEFKGPLTNRSCRDVPCLLLFIIFIGGMACIAYLAVMQGNPYRFIYGVDSWGNTCNQKNLNIQNATGSGYDMTGLSKLFYFNTFYFANRVPWYSSNTHSSDSLTACILDCPKKLLLSKSDYNHHVITTRIRLCKPGVDIYLNDDTVCPSMPILPHVELMNRCIPKSIFEIAEKAVSTSVFNGAMFGEDMHQKIISDIQHSYQELLIVVGISFAVSLIIVIMLRFLAAIIIWSLVSAVVLLSVGSCAYCWYEWNKTNLAYHNLKPEAITNEMQQKVDFLMSYSIISSTITTIILLILLVMRKRIGLVVQLFNEAGKAIGKMPMLLVMPIFTLIILLAALGGLAILSVYIETSGDPHVLTSGVVEFRFSEMWNYIRWYHLFGILWISAFIIACQDIVIAGAVATWFFTRDKNKMDFPICTSIWRLIRYHLGSVAFGSFIIALVRLVRLILGFIQAKLKGKTSHIVDILLKILQCCLWCFDRFLRYLNRNAYIEISIYGYSFCGAAKKAFFKLLSNVLRVGAINSIGSFVLFLGKLSVVVIALISGNELLKNRDEINFIWVPITLGCAMSFLVANCYLLIYEITIDTIFLCFCEDIERNDGVNKKFFMSKSLQKYMTANEKKQEKIEKMQQVEKKSKEKEPKNLETDEKRKTGSNSPKKHRKNRV